LYANSKYLFSSQLNYLSSFLDIKALNLFLEPIYGPGMSPPRLIPYIFEQCAKKETVIINSSKNLQRHFVNIEDLMTAINYVIDSFDSLKSDIYIKGKKKYTLEEIADKIASLTNPNTKIKYLNNNAIAYDFERTNNIPSLQDVSSWVPKVSLISGLKKIMSDGLN
jgi:nucleoside-diphosphate-sugar epimerase